MKAEEHFKRAKIIWIIGIVYFIVYNSIYGWNKYPMDDTERCLDYIFKYIWCASLIEYLTPLFKIYRKKVEEFDKDENK